MRLYGTDLWIHKHPIGQAISAAEAWASGMAWHGMTGQVRSGHCTAARHGVARHDRLLTEGSQKALRCSFSRGAPSD